MEACAVIVDFTVKNFRSVKETQTLSMLAAKQKEEHGNNVTVPTKEENISILKSSVLFGANASGKTNIIRALEAFRDFVVDSTRLRIGEHIPFYEPFELDKNYQDAPVSFELEFYGKENVRYKYAVAFTLEAVLSEELVFFPKKQPSRLFFREKGKAIKFGPYLKGRKKNIEIELLPNNLFLSKAANSNHEQLKDIYLFFLENLRFSFPGSIHEFYSLAHLESRRENTQQFRNKLANFLKAADTGIQSIGTKKGRLRLSEEVLRFTNPATDKRKKKLVEELPQNETLYQTYHKVFDGEKEVDSVPFDLEQESNGTVKMFHLAGHLIKVLEGGFTFMVDELDSSIHPLMSEFIIELFHNPEKNPNNAQLIFTTNDTALLNPGIFRRDQVWFTSKDRFGATTLFSLDEFDKNEVRKNVPFDKWYLNGRFGALPLIDKSLFNIGTDNSERLDHKRI